MNTFLLYYKSIKDKFIYNMDLYNIKLKSDNKFVNEALEEFKTSNGNGKYLRATLIALGYNCFKDGDDYIPLALAYEIFQTSILIHDDIIDDASKRRDIDTIPIRYQKKYNCDKHFSNSIALCLGDLGFYYADKIILNNYKDNENIINVLNYYNDIVIKTCYGEIIDVALPFHEKHNNTNNLENQIMEIYKLKTAYYTIIGPFCLGCILAGLKDDKIKLLEDALLNLGIAFQIKDDILGIFGNEEVIGKSNNSDILEYKQTILYAYTKNTKYKEKLKNIYGTNKTKEVKDLFIESGALKYANNLMDNLFNDSINKIKNLDFIKEDKKDILIGFASYLKNREK